MNRRKISAGLLAGALALFGLGAGVAHAQAPKPAAPPAPSSFILPLGAVGLTVDVTTGPGGAITDVSVNPSEPVTVSKARPNRVAFTVDSSGVKVQVKSKGQTQSVSARAASLADLITAPGGWSGDLWGDGSVTTVAFTVGDAGDGTPTLAITDDGGGTVEGPTTFSDDDGEESGVKASITFTNATATTPATMSRTLTIKVKVENESDDDDDDSPETHASVKISLGKIRGVAQDAGAVIGVPQQWSGLLCDGTTGTINFTVDADGTITITDTVPTEVDRIKSEGRKAEVRFSKDERVKIRTSINDAGQITIDFQEKIRCRDAQNPTVNGQPVTSVDDDHDDDHHDGDHHRGGDDNGGRRGGGGDHDSDD